MMNDEKDDERRKTNTVADGDTLVEGGVLDGEGEDVSEGEVVEVDVVAPDGKDHGKARKSRDHRGVRNQDSLCVFFFWFCSCVISFVDQTASL